MTAPLSYFDLKWSKLIETDIRLAQSTKNCSGLVQLMRGIKHWDKFLVIIFVWTAVYPSPFLFIFINVLLPDIKITLCLFFWSLFIRGITFITIHYSLKTTEYTWAGFCVYVGSAGGRLVRCRPCTRASCWTTTTAICKWRCNNRMNYNLSVKAIYIKN